MGEGDGAGSEAQVRVLVPRERELEVAAPPSIPPASSHRLSVRDGEGVVSQHHTLHRPRARPVHSPESQMKTDHPAAEAAGLPQPQRFRG